MLVFCIVGKEACGISTIHLYSIIVCSLVLLLSCHLQPRSSKRASCSLGSRHLPW